MIGREYCCEYTFQWRPKECDIVSNHGLLDCLLKSLFRRRYKKNQRSASLTFVMETNRWPVDSANKGLVMRKTFPFDNVNMKSMSKKSDFTFHIVACVTNVRSHNGLQNILRWPPLQTIHYSLCIGGRRPLLHNTLRPRQNTTISLTTFQMD